MSVARRAIWLGPLLLSALAHALLLGLGPLSRRLPWPKPPIPIEVLPVHRAAPPPVAAPLPIAAPPPSAKQGPAVKRPARPHRKRAPRPAPPPPAPAVGVSEAQLVVLLRMEPLRRSPHRAAVEGLLASLPDWRTLVAQSGISPLDDFDALLIATADPQSVSATFLAAHCRQAPKLEVLRARASRAGDSRLFSTPRPDVALLAPPQAAAELAQEPSSTPGSWRRLLDRLDEAALSGGGPALSLTLSNVSALLRFGDELPTPDGLSLALTADASPELRLRADFRDASEAHALARAWPQILNRYRAATALLGLGSALDGLRVSVHGRSVELAGRLPEAPLRTGLRWLRALSGGALDAPAGSQ